MPKHVPRTPASQFRGYPLSILFVLVAVCAIFAAALAPVIRATASDKVAVHDVSVFSAGGALVGSVIGGTVGLYHYRRGRGLLYGVLTGLLIGAALGPLSLAPLDSVPSLFALFAAAALMLVGVAAAFNLAVKLDGD